MIRKILGVILAIVLISASGFLLYQSFPQKAIEMNIESSGVNEPLAYVDYGATPVFLENLRFDHTTISYHIEDNCPQKRADAMREAFMIFHEEMTLVEFEESDSNKADILVGCSNNYIAMGENLFAAGEGGPSEIVNTSLFRVIRKGKISLYEDPRCDYPNVELHELCHVFGFDHIENEKSIMYNISKCDQRITDDMPEIIQKLYSIEPKAELRISDLKAVKKGKYLDFNLTVLNEGLKDARKVELVLVSEGEEIEKADLGDVSLGYGRTLKAQNIYLPSRNINSIDFIIDQDQKIPELNKENNIITMTLETQ